MTQGQRLTLGRREAPSRGEGQARAVPLRATSKGGTPTPLPPKAPVAAKGSARPPLKRSPSPPRCAPTARRPHLRLNPICQTDPVATSGAD